MYIIFFFVYVYIYVYIDNIYACINNIYSNVLVLIFNKVEKMHYNFHTILVLFLFSYFFVFVTKK